MFEERRVFPRYGFQADVEINMDGKRLRSFLTDVSVGGVFIVARTPLWVGAEFDLKVLLAEPIEARCQVRRAAIGQGMGVLFMGLSDVAKERLDRLLRLLAV